jgi:hypothetical protein
VIFSAAIENGSNKKFSYLNSDRMISPTFPELSLTAEQVFIRCNTVKIILKNTIVLHVGGNG